MWFVGDMVSIRCDCCGLDRGTLMLGAGMAGTCHTLCVCEKCKRLVVKRQTWGQPSEPFRCPYCHRPVVTITFHDEHTPCPACGAQLTLEWVGIWD
jgi:RNA polymerase subunit RPABC4/transcription elongation factor Spt4